jgi:thymidylate synthase (FAD)
MNFLSLRVDAEGNTFETKPQWEIQQVALQMDAFFKEAMPHTWAAFEKNGRVAP